MFAECRRTPIEYNSTTQVPAVPGQEIKQAQKHLANSRGCGSILLLPLVDMLLIPAHWEMDGMSLTEGANEIPITTGPFIFGYWVVAQMERAL
jgi:hypothetical protein